MRSTTFDQERLGMAPNPVTWEMPIPPTRTSQFVRALAVSRSSQFGDYLLLAHRERQKKIARETEEKLRAFMESMANKD